MKLKQTFALGLAFSAVSVFALPMINPVQAQETRFFCGTQNGIPATVAQRSGRTHPIIQFKSEYFSSNGWTPERRCQEVSERFQRFYAQGTLKYITTGKINGMHVLCIAAAKGGDCIENGLLLTLRQGNNPNKALRQLLNLQTYGSGVNPVNESAELSKERIYISVDELLRNAPGK